MKVHCCCCSFKFIRCNIACGLANYHELQVIKGWDLGVATMKKGEKCDLICRADYAYGDNGSPPKIPGGATLKFEVSETFDADVKGGESGSVFLD